MLNETIKAPRILLIGDSCTDVFEYVKQTNRQNPEAPNAPLYTIVQKETKQGMAGFVRECLSNLNFNVCLVTQQELGYQGSIKTRVIDSRTKNQICRIDEDWVDTTLPHGFSDIKTLPDKDSVAAVVVSDYCKGFLSHENILYIAEKYKGLPLFLDTKKTDLSAFGDYIIKINKAEAFKATGWLSHKNVIITRGENGAVWYQASNGLAYQGHKVFAKDVCGAGDAFLAGLVYGYFNQEHCEGALGRAIDFALANSAISVTKESTYAPSKQELLNFMLHRSFEL